MAINLKSMVPTESALDTSLTWINFKGIEFQIRYISRITLSTIAQQCAIAVYDPAKKGRSQAVDPEKFTRLMAETIVHDWRQVTVRSLSTIIPLKTQGLSTEELDTEIPFEREQLLTVLLNAHELDNYLHECATDPSLFRAKLSEEAVKNSESSQSGS